MLSRWFCRGQGVANDPRKHGTRLLIQPPFVPRRLAGSFVVFLLSATTLFADDVHVLGGMTITGKLQNISASEITMKTDKGSVTTPLSRVLAVDLRPVKGPPPDAKYIDVRLLDDSLLHCRSAAFRGNDVELTLLSGARMKASVNFLTWMLKDADQASLRKKFEEILAQRSKRDRIVIERGGELNALEGTLGDIDARGATIQFRRDGAEPISVLFERLEGLIFYRTEVSAATPLCRVYDTDGTTLAATQLSAGAAGDFALTTSLKTKVLLKREAVARLDFNIGKLTYLSDLEPAKVVERSGIGLVTHYRKDANLDGEPILLDRQYAKGLALHAHTELSYNLAGKYKDFKARLGVDARTGADSHALVTIYCDGEKRFAQTVTVKTGADIALSVKDVNTLRIVVSSGNFLDLHDHATLADARVSQ